MTIFTSLYFQHRGRCVAAMLFAVSACVPLSAGEPRPNVILIMTDDMGLGDLGVMGNPVIETPHIDALANHSAWGTQFYVHPVCTPTRACLMTGRYNYRTRAIDTYLGRAMMDPAEVTIAEILSDAGYRTGIFGKWHLGDCFPMRAIDQGFQHAVVHRGGGIGQPSDPIDAHGKYTDPVLFRNGNPQQFKGYCTDIYYDEAIKFIKSSSSLHRPFFVYLPDNCPHGPFNDVPRQLYQRYKSKSLAADQFPQSPGHPMPEKQNQDRVARIYAMISNIDRNIGRLRREIDALQLSNDTIVIYMHDNGPNSQRYVAGLKGMKSSVHEGGIRSPFFISWPGQIEADHRFDTIAAHIDLMPTIASLCSVDIPAGVEIDGRNLSPLILGKETDWTDRHIIIQSHRGDQPFPLHHCAIRNQHWKLVHPSGFGREKFDGEPRYELYDMQSDSYETNNVADLHPDVVKRMREVYSSWFEDVSSTRKKNYDPPRIVLGDRADNSQFLTRQDWRRIAGSNSRGNGRWMVSVKNSCDCRIKCYLPRNTSSDRVVLKIGEATYEQKTDSSGSVATFQQIQLQPGEFDISGNAMVLDKEGIEKNRSIYQMDILCTVKPAKD